MFCSVTNVDAEKNNITEFLSSLLERSGEMSRNGKARGTKGVEPSVTR